MKHLSLISLFIFYSVLSFAQDTGDFEELVVSGIFIPDEKRTTSEISNVIDLSLIHI